jgi:hypothetical protein
MSLTKQSIELSPQAQQEAMHAYAGNMEKQRREARAKEQGRVLAQKATEMVDSGGGFLECESAPSHRASAFPAWLIDTKHDADAAEPVFDPEMQLFFAGITKVDKWKWELDVAANKAGGRYSPNPEPTKDGRGDITFDVQPDFFADGMDGQKQQDNVSPGCSTPDNWVHR